MDTATYALLGWPQTGCPFTRVHNSGSSCCHRISVLLCVVYMGFDGLSSPVMDLWVAGAGKDLGFPTCHSSSLLSGVCGEQHFVT